MPEHTHEFIVSCCITTENIDKDVQHQKELYNNNNNISLQRNTNNKKRQPHA